MSVKQPLSAFPKLLYPLSHFQINLTLTPPHFSAWAQCRADTAVPAPGVNPKPPSIPKSCQEGVPTVGKYWHVWKILVLWSGELLEVVTPAGVHQQCWAPVGEVLMR